MSKKRKSLIIWACLFLCVSYAMVVSADDKCSAQKNSTGFTMRPAVRALAMLEIQNLMSKHAYYHASGKHLEELNDLWVSLDGEYAETATWSNPFGVWEGMDLIYEAYYVAKHASDKEILDVICDLYPEIENTPENIGIGSEYTIHTQTTPIIEVAGDGQSAKGIWYSIGMSNSGVITEDGDVGTSGMWFWEKYGADFVKEDGEWKLWHIQMYYDNTPDSFGDEGSAIGTPGGGDLPDYTRENPDPYEAWTPTKLPRIQPRIPEPYYTFCQTFSY